MLKILMTGDYIIMMIKFKLIFININYNFIISSDSGLLNNSIYNSVCVISHYTG